MLLGDFSSCKMMSFGLMVAVGIYAKLSQEASAVDSLLADPSLILLTVGILMFGITFVGCTGALRDLPVLLKIFAWILLIILILQIVAAVLGFLFSGMVTAKPTPKLADTLLYPKVLLSVSLSQFECCGVHSYKDWSQNIYFECQDSNPSLERCAVPFSCCIQKDQESVLNTMCGYGTQNLRSWKAESLIYIEGCLEKIVGWGQRNLLLVAGLAIGLFFLEVTEAVTALRLFSQVLNCCSNHESQWGTQSLASEPWVLSRG
uniref:Tetraspanin n=1 Tax=Terrapene triunguis TaxID=2587831 RepID=A0A674J398_9SAUR